MGAEGLSVEELSVLAALRAGDAEAVDRLASLDAESQRRVMAALTEPAESAASPAAVGGHPDSQAAAAGGAPAQRRWVVVAVAVAAFAIAGAGAWILYNSEPRADTASATATAVEEPPSSGFAAVAAGLWHSCGLRADATVVCWGDNADGQTDTPEGTFTAIAAGLWHSCGLRTDATVTCWGDNQSGQTDAPAGAFTAITAGGDHACGLRTDKTVTCWGNNEHGQTDAPAGAFTAITAGDSHSCGVTADATTTCWGDNTYGGTDEPPGTITSIVAGAEHACGLSSDGTVTCWGDNTHGQTNTPQGAFSAIASGNYHACGLATDNTVTCWGNNEHGQANTPPGTYTAITAGAEHTCALATDNTITCWGNNTRDQINTPGAFAPTQETTPTSTPTQQLLYADTAGAIWIADTSGRPPQLLLDGETYSYPQWSPDSSSILFNVDRGQERTSGIWIMDADGSNIRPLHLGSDGFAFTPSPDGEFLALYAFPSGLVLGRNVDGGMAETGIGTDPDIDINPITVAWSPDSKRLAYAGDLSDDRWRYPENCGQHDCPEVGLSTAAPGKRGPFMSGHAGIFVIDADGSNHRMVVSSAAVWGSSEDARIGWSPDGKSILFADRSGVYVAAPDGSRLDRLTQVESYLPTWSPDGSQIAYVSHEVEWAPDGEQIAWRNEETGIWVMNADGTEQRQLTPSDKSATWPVWSPDGTKIAYIDDPGYQIGSIVGQDRSGPHEIWVMNSDGTAPQLVANNHGVRWTYPDGQVIQQVHWLPGPGMTPSVIPTPQEEPSVTAPWAAVSAGYEHTCAVRSGPTIACWGSAPGNPPWGNYSAVSAGRYHSCGVRSDATIACWGPSNTQGRDFGQTDAPSGTFTSVSAGRYHSCGVRSDATIACWGHDGSGRIDAPSGTFTSVSAGGGHSCGVLTDSTIICWGSNNRGQAGVAGRVS